MKRIEDSARWRNKNSKEYNDLKANDYFVGRITIIELVEKYTLKDKYTLEDKNVYKYMTSKDSYILFKADHL